ncbi:MAG: hypothetical protein KBD36_03195 [Alphaproteobacteria bacterium]|nr:hypothetical protein [Alphaproteobacteria bacterium]MBP9776831.1 hypothetical protein [Alphaproteobacteria bacterium]
MPHNFLFNAIFHKLLKAMDYDLSQEERAKGCPHCGGALHRADYLRSPIGIPKEHREYYEDRYSHCCYKCRKRATSPSLRFFGRRWYPGPLFIWISTLLHGGVNKCCEQTKRIFGIILSKKTVTRWKRWWREAFKKTQFWKWASEFIPCERLNGSFPNQLFSMYTLSKDNTSLKKELPERALACFEGQLIWVLTFLTPLVQPLRGNSVHAEFASLF